MMVLVTGGTGLVGSHLILNLLNRGYQVKVLVRKNSHRKLILNTFSYYSEKAVELFNKIIWAEGDLLEITSIEDALEGVQQVYHTAAFISFNPWLKKKIIETNVEGTANVINVCIDKSIEKLCFVSSIAALGITEDGSEITENVPWKPTKHESAYAFSKFKSEMEVWRGITEGLRAIIVCPSVIFGPGNWEKGSGAIIKNVKRGVPFYTDGVTGFVDVKDVAEIMIQLMESNISGERFIVSSENVCYKDLLTTIASNLNVKPPQTYLKSWLSGIMWRLASINSFVFSTSAQISRNIVEIAYKKIYYSSAKVEQAINFKFKPVKETLEEVISLYQKDSMN
jgi:nucleoside-diphosphate-sugar epimerase